MIKVRVPDPFKTAEQGSLVYYEYEREWVPRQPIFFYIEEDLRDVEWNKVVWNGRALPATPHRDLSACDKEIMDTLLHGILPMDGDEITLIPGMGDPISAGTIIGISIAGTVYGVSAAVLNFAIMTAISLVIGQLMSFLLAPAQPKGQAMTESATSYGWNGIQNSYGPGDSIPVILGRHRVSVKVVHYSIEEEYYVNKAKTKIDLTQTKSYLKILGCVGHGPIQSLTDIRVDDNPITNYGSEVEYYTRLGTLDQTAIPGFDEAQTTYETNVEIKTPEQGGTPYTYTTTEGVALSGFKVHLECPGGLYFQGDDGMLPNELTYKIEHRVYTLEGSNPWTVDGQFDVKASKTTALRWAQRVDGLSPNRFDVRVSLLTIVHDGQRAAFRTFVKKITEITETNPRTYAGYAMIAIKALATEHLSDNPPTVTALAEGSIMPTWNGSAWVDAWTDNPAFLGRELCKNTTWGFGSWLPAEPVHDTYIKNYAAYCAENNLLVWSEELQRSAWVATNVTVAEDTVQAPYAAASDPEKAETLTATANNATILQAITGVSAQRTGSIYLKRKTGTGAISVTADGSTWTVVAITADAWTRVTDTRTVENPSFGIKFATSGDEVYAWGSMLHTGDAALPYLYSGATAGIPRQSCNFVWDQRKKLYPILQDVWGTFRGMFFRAGGKFLVVPDRPRTPSQLFTMGNIVQGSLQPEWVDERLSYNAYHVSYLAANQNYKPNAFQVDMAETPVRLKNITLAATTNGNLAVRNAKYELNIAKLLHHGITFEAGIDAILCLPGQVIRFAHEFIRNAGQVSGRAGGDSAALNEVFLDESITLDADKTYDIVVRFSGGDNPDVVEQRRVAEGPGTYASLTVTAPFSQLVQRYDLYSVGEINKVFKLYSVLQMTRKSNQTCQLHCLEYNENVYWDAGTLDDSNVVPLPSPTELPPNPILACNAVEEVQKTDTQGNYLYNLVLDWVEPENSSVVGKYLGGNIYHCAAEINTILGDFAVAEGWVNGELNETFIESKIVPSRKVTSTNGAWASTNRNIVADLSADANDTVVLSFFIDYLDKIYDGTCIKVLFKKDDTNYFSYTRSKSELQSGPNCIVAHKSDFATSGSITWAEITQYELSCRAKIGAGISIEVSFDCFYFLKPLSWNFLAAAEGSRYRMTNVQQGQSLLFRLHSFAASAKRPENPVAAYAYAFITGHDSTPPSVPSTLLLYSEGLLIRATVDANTEDTDFDGFEFHASMVDDFAPDATTLKQRGRDNVCTIMGTASGQTWYVKVRSYDKADPANNSAYCSQQAVLINANTGVDATPPTPNPPEGMAAVDNIYNDQLQGSTLVELVLSWNVCTDTGGPVRYEVEYWKDGASDKKKRLTSTTNELTIPGLETLVTYWWRVRATDPSRNVTNYCADQSIATGKDETPPSMADVTLTVSSKRAVNLLKWTKTSVESDLAEWNIYRNTTGVFSEDDYYDKKSRASRSFRDTDIGDGQTYYYWLKGIDISGNVSVDPSNMASPSAFGNVTFVTAGTGNQKCNFDGVYPWLIWTPVADTKNLEYYEIRTEDANWGGEGSGLVYRGTKPKVLYTDYHNVFEGDRSKTFYLKARDKAGNFSETADSVALSKAAPDMTGYSPSVVPKRNGRKFIISWSDWDEITRQDLDKTEVYASTTVPCPIEAAYLIDTATKGAKSITLSKMESDVDYDFRLLPYDVIGVGEPSD